MLRIPALALLALTLAIPAAAADDWPHWRGPLQTGAAPDGDYPAEWSPTENVQWSIELPGLGCSTPVVFGEQILLTSEVEGQDAVLCYSWSGEEQWQTDIGPQRPGKHRNASGSNPSIACDGEHLFAYFKSGNLAGLDMNGQLLWKTNLQDRFGEDTLYWDIGTSPVVTENDVVVAVMQERGSYLVAFEKKSGELHWKVDRNYRTPREGDHSYATPVVVKEGDREVIVAWGAERVTAHDASNGELIWVVGGFNPNRWELHPQVASLVISGDIVVVPYGRTEKGGATELVGIRLGGEGDVSESHRLWRRPNVGAFVPSPAIADGRVYSVSDTGEVVCLDLESGETLWTGQFPESGRAKFYGSPTIAGGKIYAPREDGVIFVADITDGFKFLAENEMRDRIIATPVALRDRLLIRTEGHLYAIGESIDIGTSP